MQTHAVLLLFLVTIGTSVLSAEVEDDEELDPFDMINFDHTNMRMRKKGVPDGKVETEQPSGKEKEQTTVVTPPAGDTAPESTPPVQQKQCPPVEECPKADTDTGGYCPALSLFQQFVSRLLRLIAGKVSQVDTKASTNLCIRLRLTAEQVEELEDFRRDHREDREFSAHDILNEAIQGVHVLDPEDPRLRYLWVEEKFGVTVDKALQIVQIFGCLLVTTWALTRIAITPRFFFRMLLIVFVVSVGMTWYRLYKGEVAKQLDAFIKDLPAGCSKMPDSDSTWTKMVNFMKYQFTFQQDACVTYYEHLIVDPIVKVSPMDALAVAVVQAVLKPMRTVGTEISAFIRALVKDLPVQWQMITVILVCAFVVLIVFCTCGYGIRIPFLLAIERPHSVETAEVKRLENTIHQLQATIQDMESQRQQPLAQPQPCQTVGSLPANRQSSPAAIGPAVTEDKGVRTDVAQSLLRSQAPHRNLPSETALEENVFSRPVQETSGGDVTEAVMFEGGDDTANVQDGTRPKSVMFEGGDDTANVQDGLLPKSVLTSQITSESQSDVCQSQQVRSERASTSSSTTADTDACVPPESSDRDTETVGSVSEIGQSGDAATANLKPAPSN